MSGPRGAVLLVDDEEKILKRLGRALRDQGHDVVEAASARDAQRQLAQRPFDLFVIDNVMPGTTGLELLRDVFASIPEAERPQVVMMTAHGSTQIVREAFKLGVEDFLEKPFELDELIGLARRAVRSRRLQTERQYLLSERDADFNHYGIVGRSRAMQEVITRADLVGLVRRGLAATGGNYRAVLATLGMQPGDYKRFLNLLSTHGCTVDFREFRSGRASPAFPASARFSCPRPES